MQEPETESSQWSFFNIDNLFSNNYYGDGYQYDCNEHQYYKDDHFRGHTDDDEALARVLQQEELYGLSIAQPLYTSVPEEEYLRSSYAVPRQEEGDGLHESEDAGSFWSSPGNASEEEEDNHSLDITDETELDGEVGRRLHQMIPVPHVPRINGDIPSADEATCDYQRLLYRLQLYDLIEHKVQGDGNCQFRALSDQLYRTPEHHKFVRQQVVQQLKAQPEMYNEYVPMEYTDYLKKISKSGEWGDHVTLKAAADSYGVRITVVTSFKDTCYIEILPNDQKSKRAVCLSFWAEVHYNSIYPRGDVPPCDLKRKKRWWNFTSTH